MKKLIPILIIFISFNAFSQGREQMKDRIKAQKVAFITEKLSLTGEEAQGFWPIYNDFEAKVDKIKSSDLRGIKNKMRSNPDMSSTEADALLNKLIKAENELHAAKLKLVGDLKKVISSEKIIKLKAAEDQFNRKLLEKLKEMRENRSRKN
ncbi:MAG: sensor of ECF-type sigma factor [Winogradskyella sp.]|uniref:sensor of ECF-type sigma factor n=1 Tax=Winogradskyella sp. TaxID=1883156 RepID=UPI0017EF7441|nr:sensor of ECF-type sigma factor [Winogradskyella sp.]